MEVTIRGIKCNAERGDTQGYAAGSVVITSDGMTIAVGDTLTEAVNKAKSAFAEIGVQPQKGEDF